MTKADRRQGLGATDMARILSGQYGGEYQVFLEKTRGVESAGAEHLDMGKALEPVLMAEARRRWRRRVRPGVRVHRHGTPLWATLDAQFTNDEPLDFKSSGEAQEWGPDGSGADGVPEYVWCQMQAQMLVCNAQRGHVLLLLGSRGFEFRYYEIPRDEDTCAAIDKIAVEWWQKHVVEGVAPSATDDDFATASTLLARRPPTPGAIVKWSREEAKVVEMWRKAKEGKSALDFMENAAKGRILAAMGDAETIELPGGKRLVRKVIQRSGYTVDAGEYIKLVEE